MNWFATHRQHWITQMLDVYGFINRRHLMRMFGISKVQAAHDLIAFQRAHPGVVRYNPRTKRYEVTR